MIYAGFWLRAVAFVIDILLLAAVNILVNPGFTQVATSGDFFAVYYQQNHLTVLLILMIRWLYFTLMESSNWQATLGKRALGIKVTDELGNKISFARANGRFFSKIISAAILFIGFFMAAFTEKKQALHDIIARTLVIRK